MTATAFTPEQKDAFFGEILHLYDLADDVVNAIGADGVTNRKEQLEIAAPLIEQANRSIDAISMVVTEIEKQGATLSDTHCIAMKRVFHEFFLALKRFTDDAEDRLVEKKEVPV